MDINNDIRGSVKMHEDIKWSENMYTEAMRSVIRISADV